MYFYFPTKEEIPLAVTLIRTSYLQLSIYFPVLSMFFFFFFLIIGILHILGHLYLL